jgi:hypothetical protein
MPQQCNLVSYCTHKRKHTVLTAMPDLMVHDHVHKHQPLIPILSQMNPIHILPPYLFMIHFKIVILSTPRSSKWSLLFRFSNQNLACISHSSMHAAFLSHPDLISLTIFGEYKLWSSLLCSVHQAPFSSSIISSNILFITLLSNTLNLCPSLNVGDQVSHP